MRRRRSSGDAGGASLTRVARRLVPVAPLLLLAIAVPGLAAEISDYDRRAVLTLYNSIQTEITYTIGQISDEAVNEAVVERDGDGVMYMVAVGENTELLDTRGYYRISVGLPPTRPEESDWELLRQQPDTASRFYWKRIDRGPSSRSTNVAGRRQVGTVTLTVAMRRPFDEHPEVGGEEMASRLSRLFAEARHNNLFAELRVEWVHQSGAIIRADGESGPLLATLPEAGAELRITLRAEVRDGLGQPIEGVEYFALRIGGPMADFVQLLGARYLDERDMYVVRDRSEARVGLLVEVRSPELVEAIYRQQEPTADFTPLEQAGLRIKVGAKLAQGQR